MQLCQVIAAKIELSQLVKLVEGVGRKLRDSVVVNVQTGQESQALKGLRLYCIEDIKRQIEILESRYSTECHWVKTADSVV
jgi:hypothetical protein